MILTNRDFQGMLFRYTDRSAHIAISGKTLAGWLDPRQKVFAPCILAFLSPVNEQAYEYFVLALFRRTGLALLHDPTRLLKFRDEMVACFLMHMVAMEEDVGPDDPIIQHVVMCGAECGISKAKLQEWGALVKTRFLMENAKQQVDGAFAPTVVSAIQELSACFVTSAQHTRATLDAQTKAIEVLTKLNNE